MITPIDESKSASQTFLENIDFIGWIKYKQINNFDVHAIKQHKHVCIFLLYVT